MKTAAQTSHEIITSLTPIISDADTTDLMKRGWIKSVMDLERKWAQFIADHAQKLSSVQEIEDLPRARYLRRSAQLLIESPSVYAAEERGLLGQDKWDQQKHLFQ